jgi:hypothetical protein
MGRNDFEFGYNLPGIAPREVPTYALPKSPTPNVERIPENVTGGCLGRVSCERCKKFHGYCSEVNEQLTGIIPNDDTGNIVNKAGIPYSQWEKTMDLSKQVSGKKRDSFEKRDWIAPEDLPVKGSSKWKIDGTRDAKANKTGILIYVDLTRGKLKRVMSLRKNFTLDQFCDALGTNSDKWAGKTIDLERGGSEGQYVNVSG